MSALAAIDGIIADMGEPLPGTASAQLQEARSAMAELLECVGDAQALLTEIDAAVRKEHAKNGAPQSKSVAGIVSERLAAAVARCGGAA